MTTQPKALMGPVAVRKFSAPPFLRAGPIVYRHVAIIEVTERARRRSAGYTPMDAYYGIAPLLHGNLEFRLECIADQHGDSAGHFQSSGTSAYQYKRQRISEAAWTFLGFGLFKGRQDLVPDCDCIRQILQAGIGDPICPGVSSDVATWYSKGWKRW
jgi:hypothetical protein